MISYEFPINERIRTLLRLEYLYDRTMYHLGKSHPYDHHAALLGIFEIMEVASRADLKSDLIQELDRQRLVLEALRDNPNISESALDQVLGEIETSHDGLLEMAGKFGQHLRDNEWLMAIKQRVSIPGGVCEFDLPSYYHWQKRPAEVRQADLQQWIAPLQPIKGGVEIVLRLLRDSAKVCHYTARQGVFQQMSGGKVVQMLVISVPENLPYVPELSANKYAINVRFVSAVTTSERPKVCEQDVDFVLSYCNL